MLVKIHKSYRNIVAICDIELKGKKFEEGDKELDITSTFFGDEDKDKEEAIKAMQFGAAEDATFNIVGPKSIELAIKEGIVKQEGIMNIQGIPFALVLL